MRTPPTTAQLQYLEDIGNPVVGPRGRSKPSRRPRAAHAPGAHEAGGTLGGLKLLLAGTCLLALIALVSLVSTAS
jgi:hypothetical protein